jgi:uncharacterized protein
MAKKDYPGLVIVPPSDRTILRRRVVRWSLLLIPVIWITWTVIGSPPVSHDDRDCQDTTSEDTPRDPTEACGQSHQSIASVETHENDFGLTHISQAEDVTQSQHSTPSSTPETNRLSPAFTSHEDPTPKSSTAEHPPADRTGVDSNNEKSVARAPARKTTPNPTPDAQLAERGDAFAQYRLGKYYAKQKGQHAPESIGWYKKASTGLRRLAEVGNGQAMYVLGVMYAYGRGVTRNTDEARHWLSQAVRQNITAAQPVLAGLDARQTPDPKQKGGGPALKATPQKSPKSDR